MRLKVVHNEEKILSDSEINDIFVSLCNLLKEHNIISNVFLDHINKKKNRSNISSLKKLQIEYKTKNKDYVDMDSESGMFIHRRFSKNHDPEQYDLIVIYTNDSDRTKEDEIEVLVHELFHCNHFRYIREKNKYLNNLWDSNNYLINYLIEGFADYITYLFLYSNGYTAQANKLLQLWKENRKPSKYCKALKIKTEHERDPSFLNKLIMNKLNNPNDVIFSIIS